MFTIIFYNKSFLNKLYFLASLYTLYNDHWSIGAKVYNGTYKESIIKDSQLNQYIQK